MRKKIFIFAFSGFAALATNAADTDYFRVLTSSLETSSFDSAPWTKPTSGSVAMTDSTPKLISVDTDVGDPLVYTNSLTSTKSKAARFANGVVISASETAPATLGDAAQGGVCCVTNTTDHCLEWYCWVKENSTTNWKRFTTETHPREGEKWVVNFETKSSDSSRQVRYSVKKFGDTGFTVLTNTVGDAVVEWFDNPCTTKDYADVVKFAGTAEYGNFAGKYLSEKASYADVTNETGKSITVVVTDDWKSDNVPSGQTVTNVPASGNGIPYWQSYVLGLDPTNSVSKPIVTAIRDAGNKTNNWRFVLTNVTYRSGSGVAVKYRVNSYSNVGCSEGKTTGTLTNITDTVEMDLPASGSAIKYYKMEINFSNDSVED